MVYEGGYNQVQPSELRAHGSFQLNFVTVRMPRDQFYNGTKWFNQSLYRQVHSSRTFSFTYYPPSILDANLLLRLSGSFKVLQPIILLFSRCPNCTFVFAFSRKPEGSKSKDQNVSKLVSHKTYSPVVICPLTALMRWPT